MGFSDPNERYPSTRGNSVYTHPQHASQFDRLIGAEGRTNRIAPIGDESVVLWISDQMLVHRKIRTPETEKQNRMMSVKREGWREVEDE